MVYFIEQLVLRDNLNLMDGKVHFQSERHAVNANWPHF